MNNFISVLESTFLHILNEVNVLRTATDGHVLSLEINEMINKLATPSRSHVILHWNHTRNQHHPIIPE